MRARRGIVALGLFIALAVPFLGAWFAPLAPGGPLSVARIVRGLVAHWLVVVALLALVFVLERRDAASIGLRRLRRWTLPLGLAAAVLLFGVAALAQQANHALGLDGDPAIVRSLMALPFWLRTLLVLTAGVFEELAFRGYALERLAELTGRPRLAALATWAVFTLCHGPSFGFAHLLPVAFIGALVTALYLWQRDLVVNIVAHAAFDGIGLLGMPALMASSRAA